MKNTKTNILKFIAKIITNSDDKSKIIKYCQTNELLIQKILFFIFGLYQQKYKKCLCDKLDFRAWKYGVIEINYHKWIKIKDDSFLNIFNINISDEEELFFLERIINNLSTKSPWELVDLSHLSYAWYANNTTIDCKISFDDINKSFDYFDVFNS